MNNYVTGSTSKTLRESKKITQAQLAEMISVSDKAVSRWETTIHNLSAQRFDLL